MVKHTQTIRRQQPTSVCVFEHFVGLALTGLTFTSHKFLFKFLLLTLIMFLAKERRTPGK